MILGGVPHVTVAQQWPLEWSRHVVDSAQAILALRQECPKEVEWETVPVEPTEWNRLPVRLHLLRGRQCLPHDFGTLWRKYMWL